MAECARCNGHGTVAVCGAASECQDCGGSGEVVNMAETLSTKEEVAAALRACHGDRECELAVMERASAVTETAVGSQCTRCGCRPGEADLWALKYRAERERSRGLEEGLGKTWEAQALLRLVLKNGTNLTPWVKSRLEDALASLPAPPEGGTR